LFGIFEESKRVKAELEQLIALQNLDTGIRKLQAELETIPQRRAEIETEHDQRAFEIKELESKRDTARSERVRLELEVAEQRARVERADRNLMSSQNEHEYTSAIREADAARKLISQLETKILEAMEIIEQSETTLKQREPEIKNLQSEMDSAVKAFEGQIRTQQNQLEVSRKERERILGTLPKVMGAMYNRISTRIRDGVAVAEAKNGSCSACFMALRPQVMSEVRRGEDVITCENCNRIIYYVPDQNSRTKKSEPASASPNL
jgi:hypothetical protein